MRGVEHNRDEKLTLMKLVLRLEGAFRRSLEPIRLTPLQADVLLYLSRHADAGVTDAAASLGVRTPVVSVVVNDLVLNASASAAATALRRAKRSATKPNKPLKCLLTH